MSTLASWSEFILLHVLPIAISQIVDWVREWQILVAALVLLIFFRFWTRAIVRAAREAARETVLAETRAFDAGLKLLRRQIEAGPDAPKAPAVAPGIAGPRSRVEPAPTSEPVRTGRSVRAQSAADSNTAVDHLRQAIRLALSTLPTSDDPLPPVSLRLYRAAIDALDEEVMDAPEHGRKDVLDRIRTELSALGQAYPPQSCRQAWQSLVKVNTLAREYYEPAPLTRAEMLAAGKQATP
jgi:hypothetical protein